MIGAGRRKGLRATPARAVAQDTRTCGTCVAYIWACVEVVLDRRHAWASRIVGPSCSLSYPHFPLVSPPLGPPTRTKGARRGRRPESSVNTALRADIGIRCTIWQHHMLTVVSLRRLPRCFVTCAVRGCSTPEHRGGMFFDVDIGVAMATVDDMVAPVFSK